MNRSARAVALAGALLALSAVVLAAMGSHLFDVSGNEGLWRTASLLHLFSAAGSLGLAALLARFDVSLLKWGAWLVVSGTVIFSGSIYLHVITGHMAPAVTPAGGMLMMAGWLLASLSFLRRP